MPNVLVVLMQGRAVGRERNGPDIGDELFNAPETIHVTLLGALDGHREVDPQEHGQVEVFSKFRPQQKHTVENGGPLMMPGAATACLQWSGCSNSIFVHLAPWAVSNE
jgi:hypothetical protein